MKWDGEKKKQFREALQKVYPDPVDLEMFVVEDLGGNIAEIWEGKTLTDIAYSLIKKTEAKGSLNELFEAFCRVNSDNIAVKELLGDRFLDQPNKTITPEQWQQIFSVFKTEDIFILGGACDFAFMEFFRKPLFVVCPDSPPLNTLEAISDFLEKYDQPDLTKAFIRNAVETLIKRDPSRDFTSLNQWNEPQVLERKPLNQKPSSGYILVSLKLYANNITVFAEFDLKEKLREPLDVDDNSKQRGIVCELDGIDGTDILGVIAEKLAEPLSNWVQQAERQLLKFKVYRQTVIEIFLPWQLLDARVDEWGILDDLKEPCKLRDHRGFIVRSLDRVTSEGLQLQLYRSWETLKKSAEIDRSLIELLLEGLPEDPEARQKQLKNILKSPVLFAFWTLNSESNREATLASFEKLLKRDNLIEFANLAEEIKHKRKSDQPISNLGMLCDCAERLPTIPTNEDPLTIPS